MSLFSKIKRMFCRHEWQISKYQMLTDDNTWTYYCPKCQSYEQQYHAR